MLTLDTELDLKTAVKTDSLNLYAGPAHILRNVNMQIPENRVTALIGPSGCGKSTLLRSFNRMHDLKPEIRIEGNVYIQGANIYQPGYPVYSLRKTVGMVFQKPNPFPKSIYENLAFGLKIHGFPKTEIPDRVESALKRSYLWNEVREKLHLPANGLSGGQQQRLCIARTIAIMPEIILLDEPCSALDPISTARIEELILDLADTYTLIMVTHNMQQAQRVANFTAFMYLGELIEFGNTHQLFNNPKKTLTSNYIEGHFG